MANETQKLTVLCVDDNPAVTQALQIKLSRTEEFRWIGALHGAEQLVRTCADQRPSLVLLDIDMPGLDPLDALADLAQQCPDTRAVMFSGHVRRDLIERAVDAGAWGYVSKNDGEDELLDVLRNVARGEFSLSTQVSRVFNT